MIKPIVGTALLWLLIWAVRFAWSVRSYRVTMRHLNELAKQRGMSVDE